MLIRIVLLGGSAGLAAQGVLLGVEAYEVGFSALGAAVLGGTTWLALTHVLGFILGLPEADD